ncbi:MAG: hydrogenase expression protein HypE [Cyanobacteria bacterium P01_A01_bin.37]
MTNTIQSIQSEKNPTFIVIGYGNPHKGDEAIGTEVISQLSALEIPNLEVHSVPQLTPELSGKLATPDYAVFVHACEFNNGNPVKLTALEAYGSESTGSGVPALGHSCDPCSLLALTKSVYGHCPKSWWVKVSARDFIPNRPLSTLARQSVAHALQVIEALVCSVTKAVAHKKDTYQMLTE